MTTLQGFLDFSIQTHVQTACSRAADPSLTLARFPAGYERASTTDLHAHQGRVRNLGWCHAVGLGRAASTQPSRRGSQHRDWGGRHVWLVRDATGEADRVPCGGRAM
jgi:hypothetical protein